MDLSVFKQAQELVQKVESIDNILKQLGSGNDIFRIHYIGIKPELEELLIKLRREIWDRFEELKDE